jgi:TetR/AcrR family transcriptional repressor of nem operon
MQPPHESKAKLLDATLKLVREKGYTATRVEDVCAEAGLTKGSFFHHFESKDDLGRAAVAHWNDHTTGFFAEAAYHTLADPLDRVLAYVDFRKANLTGPVSEFTCFAGTMVQEVHATHPEMRAACEANIRGHAKTLEADIREAMRQHNVRGRFTAESLALHTQAVVQGALLLAKATGSTTVAAQSLDHLRRYLELLFAAPAKRKARGQP